MKKRSKIFQGVLSLTVLLILPFILFGCAGGRFLFETEESGLIFKAYGSEDGIHTVEVFDGGKKTQTLEFAARRSGQPFSEDDGLSYGLTLGDFDLDGNVDVAVMTRRDAGSERYIFYFGLGGGKFEKEERLSEVNSPVFGDGSGRVSFSERSVLLYLEKTDRNPAVYEEKRITYHYGRTGDGIGPLGAEGVIYYSEQDIYCIVTYVPDPDSENGLAPDEEKWVYPEKIASYGIDPFPPLD